MYHICSYMSYYSSSCPSSPPFTVHHFARSPSDTHIGGGGFVTYTKSSPFEVRNELFIMITFREMSCLLHKLAKQISTAGIYLTGRYLVQNPLHDPFVLSDFFLGFFQSSQYLKLVSSHFLPHSFWFVTYSCIISQCYSMLAVDNSIRKRQTKRL
jgi:hypothetical protein